jgi:general secretion pathway protein A
MKRWNVPPVSGPQPALKSVRDLEKQAAGRGLKLTRYSGSLGLLVRMDYPAILEFTLPGIAGKRYLALVGMEQGKFLVEPALAGRNSLSSAELESFWSGAAWLPWKNFHDLSPLAAPGSESREASLLQQLLQDARVYTGTATGIFDRKTIAAVREFQAAQGITPDGKAGAQTLLLLYRAGGKFPIPGLGGNEQK